MQQTYQRAESGTLWLDTLLTHSFALLDPAVWRMLNSARRQAAQAAGKSLEGDSYVMTSLHLLEEGEDPYGDAARDATGHLALSLLAAAADEPSFAQRLSAEERSAVQRLLDRRGTTATAPDRYQAIYTNYLGRIAPADRDLVLPSLMDRLALVGTRDQLLARIAALEEAGVDEIVIQPAIDPQTEMAALAELTT